MCDTCADQNILVLALVQKQDTIEVVIQLSTGVAGTTAAAIVLVKILKTRRRSRKLIQESPMNLFSNYEPRRMLERELEAHRFPTRILSYSVSRSRW